MKVVVLSLADPYAAAHGGTIRTRALVSALAALDHRVTLVYPEGGSDRAGEEPPPTGVRVTPVRAETVGTRRWPDWVRRSKRALLPLPTEAGARSAALSAGVRAAGPADVLLVSVLPFAQYVRELPGARLWVDHSDLYSDVLAREAGRRTGLAHLTASAQLARVVRREDALAVEALVTTAAGHEDRDRLADRSGADVHWLPTPVAFRDVRRSGNGPKALGLLANFRYWPNRDAYDLLVESWAPRLSAAGYRVVVAGLASDELPFSPDVDVLGPVPSPADLYRMVDATLAPIRVGGGMKVKVVESLSHGRPVVATPFAVAGLPSVVAALAHVPESDDDVVAAARAAVGSAAPPTEPLAPFHADHFVRTVDALLSGAAER